MDRTQKTICGAIDEALKTGPGVTFEDDRMRAVAAGFLTGAVSNAIEAAGGYAPEGKLKAPDKLGAWADCDARVIEFENGNIGVEIAEHIVLVGQGLGMRELAEEMTQRWNAAMRDAHINKRG